MVVWAGFASCLSAQISLWQGLLSWHPWPGVACAIGETLLLVGQRAGRAVGARVLLVPPH